MARLRRGRIGVSDRWDSSGGTARDNYLTGAPYSRQFGLCARAARGHAMTMPPSSVINSRRLIRSPRRRLLEMERNLEAQRLGGLEVDHQLERCLLHHRQVAGLGAVYNLRGVNADLTIGGRNAGCS